MGAAWGWPSVKATFTVPLAEFPAASTAPLTVRVAATPAVTVPGTERMKLLIGPGVTTIVPVALLRVPSVTQILCKPAERRLNAPPA